MGATRIPEYNGSNEKFGGSAEEQFILLNINAARGDEQTQHDTFDGTQIFVNSNPNIIFDLSGYSSSVTAQSYPLFDEIFNTENFASGREYSLTYGDVFTNGWDMVFGDSGTIEFYSYLTDPATPDVFYTWPLSYTAKQVEDIFKARGQPNVSVIKIDDGGPISWVVSNLSIFNYNKTIKINNPIQTLLSIDLISGTLVIQANRVKMASKIFSISQTIENDGIMSFSINSKAYSKPITTLEKEQAKNGLFLDPTKYF